jgi:hypothetical protein
MDFETTEMLSAATVAFEEETQRILQRFRSALIAVFADLPVAVNKAADLQRLLKIDMKLCWKLHKVVAATHPLEAGPHVPGPANMRSFLGAAGRRGVAAKLIEEAEKAAAEFQEFVATHAGERAAFDSMVSALGPGAAQGQFDFQHQRAAFRANRHIWGVQAKTLLRALLVQPADDPAMLSVAVMQGCYDLRRLRPHVPLVISRVRIKDNDGRVRAVDREPLDPTGTATPHGLALMRDFCSKPLPQFQTIDAEAGFVHGEIVSDGIGNQSAVTCVHGHVTPLAGPRYRDEHNRFFRYSQRVLMPSETLILDLLVRRDTYDLVRPVAITCGELAGDTPPEPGSENANQFRLSEAVGYAGRGLGGLHSPHVPRYAEMARYAFSRLGWNPDEFDVYRCCVAYPIMASIVWVCFELPPSPAL